MGSNLPLRVFPQRVPSKWISKVEFSCGFHSITELMLLTEFFMFYLGYDGYINMYFNLIMVICDVFIKI